MNRNVFNIVVYLLGAALLLSIIGVIFLNATDNPVDDILKQVIVGALTGIAGLLARNPGEAQDVTVRNTPENPVVTEPATEH